MARYSILIVDDESVQRESLAGFLRKKGFETFTSSNAADALKVVERQIIDVMLTDFKMPGKTGLDLLGEVKMLNPEIEVIIMTAYGKIEDAVGAMKSGAFDYLTKPIDLDELEILIRRAIELRQITHENKKLRENLLDKHRFSNILTNSSVMEETLNMAARAAGSKTSILIRGESGTGKELIARAIHFASDRKDKPLITVNCAAISENLLESELFGHEKGAFTGAVAQKNGRVEEAHGSSLFLDEVGDVPLTTQVKLLRFLQFGEFQRVGSNQVRRVDVRLIAATNRDLETMIRESAFREDFYYRLNVINIHVPPLRERKEDIPLLIEHFIRKYATANQRHIDSVSREAMDILMKHHFPGNVRELENLIERAVILARENTLTTRDLPLPIHDRPETENHATSPAAYYKGSLQEKIEAFEIDLIHTALRNHDFNQTRAAEELGMTERNLRYKIKKYRLK